MNTVWFWLRLFGFKICSIAVNSGRNYGRSEIKGGFLGGRKGTGGGGEGRNQSTPCKRSYTFIAMDCFTVTWERFFFFKKMLFICYCTCMWYLINFFPFYPISMFLYLLFIYYLNIWKNLLFFWIKRKVG